MRLSRFLVRDLKIRHKEDGFASNFQCMSWLLQAPFRLDELCSSRETDDRDVCLCATLLPRWMALFVETHF
jgi:hypothetical protein